MKLTPTQVFLNICVGVYFSLFEIKICLKISIYVFFRMAVEKSPVEAGIVRAKNARQKRVIKNQAPKVVENNKSTIFIKGGNVSEAITMVFKDLHALKVRPKCYLILSRLQGVSIWSIMVLSKFSKIRESRFRRG